MEREKLQKELRRSRSTLVAVGLGVIAFAAWSALKLVLMMALNGDALFELLGLAELAGEDALARAVSFVMFGFFLAVGLALHLFIGLRARREGFARKKAGMAYLVLACLLALLTVCSDLSMLADTVRTSESVRGAITAYAARLTSVPAGDVDDAAVAILLELTSVVTLIELIAASVRVKYLSALDKRQEA